jgi:hypothetical protein
VLAQAAKGNISESEVVVIGDVAGVVPKAGMENLFDPEDYIRLFNWAFSTNFTTGDLPRPGQRIVPQLEQIHVVYDHVLPAHALTKHREEFFANVSAFTLDHFEDLVKLLNATISSQE